MGWKRNASVALGLVLMSGCGLTTDLGDGTISCSNRRDDWWRVHVSAPTTVAISVDTVSRGTAFDPSIDIYDVDVWSNNPNNIGERSAWSGLRAPGGCRRPGGARAG